MVLQIRYFKINDPTDDEAVEERINREIRLLDDADRYTNYCRPAFVKGEMYIYIVHTQKRSPYR